MTTINDRISNLRSQAEEHFYALSSKLDREQAEDCAVESLKMSIQNEIKVHDLYATTSEEYLRRKNITEYSDNRYDKGFWVALSGRITRHKSEKADLEEDLRTLELGLIN